MPVYHSDSNLGRMQASLDSKVCPACGSPKYVHKVVCINCFKDLSRSLQNALRYRSGEELLEARDTALEELRDMGVRPVEEKS